MARRRSPPPHYDELFQCPYADVTPESPTILIGGACARDERETRADTRAQRACVRAPRVLRQCASARSARDGAIMTRAMPAQKSARARSAY